MLADEPTGQPTDRPTDRLMERASEQASQQASQQAAGRPADKPSLGPATSALISIEFVRFPSGYLLLRFLYRAVSKNNSVAQQACVYGPVLCPDSRVTIKSQ